MNNNYCTAPHGQDVSRLASFRGQGKNLRKEIEARASIRGNAIYHYRLTNKRSLLTKGDYSQSKSIELRRSSKLSSKFIAPAAAVVVVALLALEVVAVYTCNCMCSEDLGSNSSWAQKSWECPVCFPPSSFARLPISDESSVAGKARFNLVGSGCSRMS